MGSSGQGFHDGQPLRGDLHPTGAKLLLDGFVPELFFEVLAFGLALLLPRTTSWQRRPGSLIFV